MSRVINTTTTITSGGGNVAASGMKFRAVTNASASGSSSASGNGNNDDDSSGVVDDDRELVGGKKLPPVLVISPSQPSSHPYSQGTGSESGQASEQGLELVDDRLSFLAHLPLTVHIVVEEGHGTKLLPRSGERDDISYPLTNRSTLVHP